MTDIWLLRADCTWRSTAPYPWELVKVKPATLPTVCSIFRAQRKIDMPLLLCSLETVFPSHGVASNFSEQIQGTLRDEQHNFNCPGTSSWRMSKFQGQNTLLDKTGVHLRLPFQRTVEDGTHQIPHARIIKRLVERSLAPWSGTFIHSFRCPSDSYSRHSPTGLYRTDHVGIAFPWWWCYTSWHGPNAKHVDKPYVPGPFSMC